VPNKQTKLIEFYTSNKKGMACKLYLNKPNLKASKPVGYAYNSRYVGGRDWEDRGSRPAWEKS
jgi:hypothetical protein